LVGLDDSFFFGGFDEGFDSLFGALLVRFLLFFFGDARERLRAFDENTEGLDEPEASANRGKQRKEPTLRGAIKKKIGDKVHRNDDFEGDEDAQLDEGFPSARDEIKNAARGFENKKREPEVAEDTKCAARATAIDFQLGFDFGFKNVEMLVNGTSGHAAEFAINEREVGKDRQKERKENNADDVKPGIIHG